MFRRAASPSPSKYRRGESIDQAFGRAFEKGQALVGAMVAGGEAAGDLAGGLQRAADILQSRLKLRDQVISVMAYPAFVLISAIGALIVILFVIVPTIAPLAAEMGSETAPALSVMIAVSDFLRGEWLAVLLGLSIALGALTAAARAGMLSAVIERILLDGPARRTVAGLIFGGFAISLGTMLAAGAPIGEALRLAIRAVPSRGAHRRLEPTVAAVRQGQQLSSALAEVKGFPQAITRLAAVGEASNALGPLLARSGKLEEEAALKRIETAGRIAGPALIIVIGAVLGLMMAALLSSVSSVGQTSIE